MHRDTLVQETLLDGRAVGRGMYRPEAVRELVTRARRDDKKSSQRLFCLLALERWQRLFVDGDASAVQMPAEVALAS